MIVSLLMFASASVELQSLDEAVSRCDRTIVNPAFSAETGRRSQFMLDAFREQEAIVTERLSLAERRRVLRETGGKKDAEAERSLGLEEALIEDRQRGLNDKRMLEGIRRETVDTMRRYFLTHCAAGKDKS